MNGTNNYRRKSSTNPFVYNLMNATMKENLLRRTYFSKNTIDDSTHCHCETNSAELLLRYAFLYDTKQVFKKPVRVSWSS